MKRALAIMLFVPLSMTGCLHRSQIKREDVKLPKAFAEKAAARKKAVGRWWKLFGDPTLDRLMSLAFRDNLDLAAAQARFDQARYRLRSATAGWLPSVQAKADFSRAKNIMNLGDFGTREITGSNLSFSLAASYEIDLWGRVYHQRKSAKYAQQASVEELRAGYITLAANLADAYYLTVQQRAQIKLLDKTIESREAQVKLVRQRYKSGVARADELYQALQSLAAAKAQREQAIGLLKTSQNAVAVLVGRFPGRIDAGDLDALPPAVKEFGAGVPGQLLKQRPDLRAALHRLNAADQQVGAAFAAHFPQIRIGGGLGYQLEPATGLVWNFFAGLVAPLFQQVSINAQYNESKAKLKESVALFKKTLLGAVKEVEDALAKGRATAKRIKWIEERVLAAEGALRLSTDQYAQGLTIYLNVLTAEQALLQARTELIAARRELIAARVSLARALGGAWMKDEVEARLGKEQKKSKTKKESTGAKGAAPRS